jgi:predicted acetyltransferase
MIMNNKVEKCSDLEINNYYVIYSSSRLGVGRKAIDLALKKIIVAKTKEVKTGWSNSRRNRQA